jgi:hypothetical protein
VGWSSGLRPNWLGCSYAWGGRSAASGRVAAHGTGSGEDDGLGRSHRMGRVGTVAVYVVLGVFAWIQVLQARRVREEQAGPMKLTGGPNLPLHPLGGMRGGFAG